VSDPTALLTESLRAWRRAGTVSRTAEDAILIVSGETRIEVLPAPPDIPFRWLVRTAARERGVTGIPGLLRTVRSALDPDYDASKLQLALRPALAE